MRSARHDYFRLYFMEQVKNEITKFSGAQYEIISEIATVIMNYGGKSDIVATIMSWGDTISDQLVLQMLKEYNHKHEIVNGQPQHQ